MSETRMRIEIEEMVRETAKAYQVVVEIDTPAGRRGTRIWLPKSQTEMGDGFAIVPGWLLGKKAADIEDYTGHWANFTMLSKVADAA